MNPSRTGTSIIECLAIVALIGVLMGAGIEAMNQLRRWVDVPDGTALDRACDQLRRDGAAAGRSAFDQLANGPLTGAWRLGDATWRVRDGRLERDADPIAAVDQLVVQRDGQELRLRITTRGLPVRTVSFLLPEASDAR